MKKSKTTPKAKKEKEKLNRVGKLRRTGYILLAFMFLFGFFGCLFNAVVVISASSGFLAFDDAASLGDFDCIIVLGALVYPNGRLSEYLQMRVDLAKELYFAGASKRILVSGDHGRDDYDEPNAMKAALVNYGIDENVIFTDHAGFNTYDTMYRAKEVFQAERVLIVTQDFHMSRAIFIARALGLDAYGVTCDSGDIARTNLRYELREWGGRAKYVLDAIFKPKPTYLGEAIPIWGDASESEG